MFFGLHLPLRLHVLRLTDYLVDWEDDMVVEHPDLVFDQAIPSASQPTVSSSLGPLVLFMGHASATNAKRLDTLLGTAPSERTISVVSRRHKVCSLHDAFGLCTNLSSGPRTQFNDGVHYHYGGDNSSSPSTSAQHPWLPSPPATNAAIHGHMPWPPASAYGHGSWFPPFHSWTGSGTWLGLLP